MISQTTDPNASRIPRGNRGGITENTSNNCLKPPGAPRPAAVERRECGSNREEKKETGQRKSDASRGRPVRDDCWHELWPRGEKCARPSECIFSFKSHSRRRRRTAHAHRAPRKCQTWGTRQRRNGTSYKTYQKSSKCKKNLRKKTQNRCTNRLGGRGLTRVPF